MGDTLEHRDAVIVGGGPAGLSAALELHRLGVRDILLVEREKQLGGILRQCIHDGFGLTAFGQDLTGPEYAQRLIDEVKARGIPFLTDTAVLNITPDKTVTLVSREGLRQLRAGAVILAMGCRERTRGSLAIPGERPAGVFTAGVAQACINLYDRMIGKDVVILGSGDVGLIMARRLTLEGANVKGVFEIMPTPSGLPRNVEQCLNDYGIPLFLSHTITAVHGKSRVTGVTVSRVDDKLEPIPGTEQHWPCDTVILSVGLIPENELSLDAGVELDPRTRGAVVDAHLQTTVPGIFAAGNVLHVHDLADNVSLEAQEAARHAAQYLKTGLSPAPVRPLSPPPRPQYASPAPGVRELVCVLCPNSCRLSVREEDGQPVSVSGNLCPRGEGYARQELTDPRRTLTTSVRLEGGSLPLVSVRTDRPIPKAMLLPVMEHLDSITLTAPVRIGDVVEENILNTGASVIVTKNIHRPAF